MISRSIASLSGLLFVFAGVKAPAQDAGLGVKVPITLSGEVLATQRLRANDPSLSSIMGSFRSVMYPTIKMGPRWFVYSAIQINSRPFYYYQSYYPERGPEADVLQAFMGYSRTEARKAFSIKVGQLPTAFGSFPLRYDDAINPLLDQPLSYGLYVKMRPDQLPCGAPDLQRQIPHEDVSFHCGGSTRERYGISPATLYGLLGAEVDVSYQHFDVRFQLTNSSPANSQGLLSQSQHAQWAAGAGVTLKPGFRVGFSAFRGPYLEKSVRAFLPAGKGADNYPATGTGIDAQWARGRWSLNGEWQWFQFQYPGFQISPAVTSAYVESKVILSPRIYAAIRCSNQDYNRPEASPFQNNQRFQPSAQAYEFALGFHLNHIQMVKLGYEWSRGTGVSGSKDNVLAVQFVTTLNTITKVFR